MKILLSITSLGVGGAERLVTSLADRFAMAGHEVLLVAFHGEIELRPAHPDVRVVNLGMRRSPWGVLAALGRFRRLVQAFRPDVVNSHLVHANILTRLLRLVTPLARLVCSAHNSNEEGRGRMLAYRLTDRLADISTNVSAEAVQTFVDQGAVRPGRMIAIDNGINTHHFVFDETAREQVRAELRLDRAAPVLLAVGRLWEAKDYPNLLHAFARLAAAPVLPWLLIAGDGPFRDELERLAEGLGVAGRVRFLGIRHDVAELMSACDVFVLSSAWEGFGLVVAEAMACERAVVATDSGGVREVVGDVGWVVPPKHQAALASALTNALALSPSARAAYGRRARSRVVARFSIELTASRYLAVFRGEVPV